ncbi:MAG: DUF86 domain-containing protein [Cyclobacteriaceae bacterium]
MNDKMGDDQRLLHIEEAIAEIESYTKGIDILEFKSNSMIRFASIKQMEIIGEAARYVTEETRNKYPEIEWKEITGLRNILVHEYFGIDSNLIWQIIETDIPDLKKKLRK